MAYFSTSYADNSKGNGLLWKITGLGIEKPSYLLGTSHSVCSTFLDSINGFHAAFESTEQLLIESVNEEYAKYVKQSSYMPRDSTYESLLSKEDLLLLNEKMELFFGENGANELKNVKPSVLIFLIQGQVINKLYIEAGITPSNPLCDSSIDKYIESTAKREKYNIMGLDEEGDAFFNRMPISTDLKKLMELLKDEDFFNNETQKKETLERIISYKDSMDKYYKLQSLKKIEELIESQKQYISTDLYMEQEFTMMGNNRNNRWMKKIPFLIKNKPSFIAVGVAHLIGKTGLINQLRNLGYNVEPIREL
ncbi:TraB/GumN family protein [Dysgonomonas sp. HDW5A]|uniref:TraB/GumN family protein n=1 Tax=Dysgonomonas sp. HDW5A TaxID=2714926 RepID=UPI00140C3241|nr:TraB/GumN family protein [Dysgonomonas sp. HDW5A]QIK61408.1 TraB/GumN family protein [Dysgonomonas sp. HDW5A]